MVIDVTCLLDPDGGEGCCGARPHPRLCPHPEVVPQPEGQLTHWLVKGRRCSGLNLGWLRLLAPVYSVPESNGWIQLTIKMFPLYN